MEFLCDLLSQLPTRRYNNSLLRDLHVLPCLRLANVYQDEDNGLLRGLTELLAHYMYFTIDDHTGVQYSRTEAYEKHCALLAKMQRIALKHVKDKLSVLALSNYGSIDKRSELLGHFALLSEEELQHLSAQLTLRTTFPETVGLVVDRKLLVEVLLTTLERRQTFQEAAEEMSILPTERTLFDSSLARTETYDGSHPLALPKLNLQYLSVGDFLWRAFVLYRCEAFYGIRRDIEDVLSRIKPGIRKSGEFGFAGFSKMALQIGAPRYET